MNARGTAVRRARLVRRPAEPLHPQQWEPPARAVIERPRGFVRVLGGPGTGKTSLLATAVASRIDAGTDPERLLVLTTSRLRLTTMATHRPTELLRAAKVIGNAAHQLGLLGDPEPIAEQLAEPDAVAEPGEPELAPWLEKAA